MSDTRSDLDGPIKPAFHKGVVHPGLLVTHSGGLCFMNTTGEPICIDGAVLAKLMDRAVAFRACAYWN